ncbi:MAG TPA: glycosyltransferase family 9 protein [Candidatus Binatia bacterium]
MSVPFLYKLNKTISGVASGIINLMTPRSPDVEVDLSRETFRKILLVRGNFRMGDSLLASPAILLFRKNFPDARIDFVGSPMSRTLFENLPIDRHYEITRRFPDASWSYFSLLKRIRSERYDLAVDVSGSQSSMGAFVVGFSGARLRAGLRGKRDRWLNLRVAKPAERNKYRALPAFVAALGLTSEEIFPLMTFTPAEQAEGKRRMETALGQGAGPIVAVFVGGRVSRRKRLPSEFFIELATALRRSVAKVAVFVGPEEKSLIDFFRRSLGPDIPVLFEPSVRMFAAMVAGCDLFVTADSGPMHLACAAGTRTVAIFQKADHRHWGPPESLARIIYRRSGATVEEILSACRQELSNRGVAVCAERAQPDAKRLA